MYKVNLVEMKEAQAFSNTPIVTNQVPYSFHSREYARNGVVGYCQAEEILITAYSPIKTVSLRTKEINSIAKKHIATAAQVSLAWILQQPAMITIPKSSNHERLRENMGSMNLELSQEEIALLDSLSR